jgi:hypothetical protein
MYKKGFIEKIDEKYDDDTTTIIFSLKDSLEKFYLVCGQTDAFDQYKNLIHENAHVQLKVWQHTENYYVVASIKQIVKPIGFILVLDLTNDSSYTLFSKSSDLTLKVIETIVNNTNENETHNYLETLCKDV